MTKEEKTFRFSQSGVHDNPDFALEFLREIELLAENVIAERREIVELNKRRDKLREASRWVEKRRKIKEFRKRKCFLTAQRFAEAEKQRSK